MSKELAKTEKAELVIIDDPLKNFLSLSDSGVAIETNAKEVKLNNFTRLEEGENRFRLVDKPVYGAEVWFRRTAINEETGEVVTGDDGAPKVESAVKRYRQGEAIVTPAEFRGWQKDKPRKFLALLVYSYKSGGVEILTVSQAKLFDDLFEKLRFSADAPNPYKSDLKIVKKFDAKKVIGGKPFDIYTYTVQQTKENEAPAEILAALRALPFLPDMDALFTGGDPFEVQNAATHE
jgi:hypothetical protein